MKKKLLICLCKRLELQLNMMNRGSHVKVELFSGIKPSNYYSPAIHIGTSKSIPNKQINAWFVEVFVDGICIFRDSMPSTGKKTEGILIDRTIQSIFNYGVMASRDVIINNHEL